MKADERRRRTWPVRPRPRKARTTAWLLTLACALCAAPALATPEAERWLCPRGDVPDGATAAPAGARALFQRVASLARANVRVVLAPQAGRVCITPSHVVFAPGELPPELTAGRPESALATGRIAYAIGLWTRHRARSAKAADQDAADQAGCLLARLGARGDDLTRQLTELRDWTAPHAHARRFVRRLQEGHARCAQ